MGQKDISKENTAVLLRSIVAENEELLMKLKVQFTNFSSMQVYTALLLKLGYTFNEIRIILGIGIEIIQETSDLIRT